MTRTTALLAALALTATATAQSLAGERLDYAFRLHDKTVGYTFWFRPQKDGSVRLEWGQDAGTVWLTGSYTITARAANAATRLSLRQPEPMTDIKLPDSQTFLLLPKAAYRRLKDKGECTLDGLTYRLDTTTDTPPNTIQATESRTHSRLTIADDKTLPVILSRQGSPTDINWQAEAGATAR